MKGVVGTRVKKEGVEWEGRTNGELVCVCTWICGMYVRMVGSRYVDMLCYLVEALGRQAPRPIAGKAEPKVARTVQ